MSSSLRNSLHRRNHKERSQLAHRSRLGILEKHKDYVQRARDFHSKQDRIKRLREKAADRNKDEFYFDMIKSRTEEGVHVKERGNAAMPTDMVKVLKSQDENYIRAVRRAGLKKIDKLKLQLTSLADLTTPGKVGDDDLDGSGDEDALDEEDLEVLKDAGILPSSKGKGKSTAQSKHIIFVSNDEQAKGYRPPHASSLEAQPGHDEGNSQEDLGWEWPESTKSGKKQKNLSKVDVHAAVDLEDLKEGALNHRGQLLKELAARIKRDTNLGYAARELEMQKLMMGKGAARKIRGIEKVEGEEADDEDDEDSFDARKKRRRKLDVGMEEKTYKPRVYKWRAERKK